MAFASEGANFGTDSSASSCSAVASQDFGRNDKGGWPRKRAEGFGSKLAKQQEGGRVGWMVGRWAAGV